MIVQNYFFEIEQAEGLKQYGKSKEHRQTPINFKWGCLWMEMVFPLHLI